LIYVSYMYSDAAYFLDYIDAKVYNLSNKYLLSLLKNHYTPELLKEIIDRMKGCDNIKTDNAEVRS